MSTGQVFTPCPAKQRKYFNVFVQLEFKMHIAHTHVRTVFSFIFIQYSRINNKKMTDNYKHIFIVVILLFFSFVSTTFIGVYIHHKNMIAPCTTQADKDSF